LGGAFAFWCWFEESPDRRQLHFCPHKSSMILPISGRFCPENAKKGAKLWAFFTDSPTE
jgi:hypothetical protein